MPMSTLLPLRKLMSSSRVQRRAVLAALLSIAAASADARNWNVTLGGSRLEFIPRELTIEPGDTVTWSNMGGFHNLVADDGSFRCANGCDGRGGNGAPSSLIWRATLPFDRPGRYGYFCEPHGQPGAGMYGTIIVTGGPSAPIIAVPVDGSPLRWLLGAALLLSALWWRRATKGLQSASRGS